MRLLLLPLLVACGGNRPDSEGNYDLGGGWTLNLSAVAGPGTCDLRTAATGELSEEHLPGFCTTTGLIEGPEQRWLLYRDAEGQIFPVYTENDVELVFAGSEGGDDSTNIKLAKRDAEGWHSLPLMWGDEEDPGSAEEVEVEVEAVLFEP